MIPISARTIQRDVKDLTDAGLIRVEFSKKENGYIHIGEPEFNPSIPDGKKKEHLQDLYRLGTLMWKLTSSPEDLAEEEIDLELEYGDGEYLYTEEKRQNAIRRSILTVNYFQVLREKIGNGTLKYKKCAEDLTEGFVEAEKFLQEERTPLAENWMKATKK